MHENVYIQRSDTMKVLNVFSPLVIFTVLLVVGYQDVCLSASRPPQTARGKTWTDPTTGMEFVWVPGGCYQMGQTGDEKRWLIKKIGKETYEKFFTDESPRHEVCVDGFWLGKYEVTNAQYRRFQSGHNSKAYGGHSLNGDNQPAVHVSWEEAKAYADWLSGGPRLFPSAHGGGVGICGPW